MLMRQRIWVCVKEIKGVSSRIMYVVVCMRKEFLSVISVYALEMETSEEERDVYLEKWRGCIKTFEDNRW